MMATMVVPMSDADTDAETPSTALQEALDRIPDEPSQRASTAREIHRIVSAGTARQRERVVFTTADTADEAQASGEWVSSPDTADLGVMR